MKKRLNMLWCVMFLSLVAVTLTQKTLAGQISGQSKKWHKVTLTFDGPQTNEKADPNPFLYYRLDVTFTHAKSGRSYLVPGYFAADGDAANTKANQGNKWRVHLAPDQIGVWKYSVSFRKGKNVAVNDNKSAGESGDFMDGQFGSFYIAPTDKRGRDFRGKGLLQYVGRHHLRFAETGEYFLKCGADAPENFLAYKDFDGDFKYDGHKDNFIKDWAPHIRDFKQGDPTWQDGKGKGIIGAVNYLASKGMNVFSFLTLNIGGDDQNVFPYISYEDLLRMDVSRLDQWEILFEHADKLGMYLHFKTMETENELLLDNGDLGTQRKLYYRELIARFSHHLALNWNLGEEINNATTAQKIAWANYLWTNDPYQHHIVIHNMNDPHYDLLGDASALTGFSLQTSKPDFSQVHSRTRNYIDRSVAAGKPWVVACDEPGDATHGLITDAEDPTRDNARKNALWGNIMAGGAGVEWYFGYKHPHSDLTCQDYRTREKVWNQCRYALEFFRKYEIPFWDMKCEDEMTANTDDYVLCKPGRIYLVYLKHGGKVQLNAASGNFTYGWFNPRTGDGLNGLLNTGSVDAGQIVEVAASDTNDWLLVIKGSGKLELASEQPPLPEVVPDEKGAIVLKAVRDFRIITAGGFVPPYKDSGHNALAINPGEYKDKFAASETEFPGETDAYDITLTTMAETDGESTYKLLIGGKLIGQFTNPKTSIDYKPTLKTWKNISVAKDTTIRIEFNTATNSNQKSGRIPYARGRWTTLTLTPTVGVSTIFEETGGLVAVEAEHFAVQTQMDVRKWYITSATQKPQASPDGDESHEATASGEAYLEVLPDTRRNNTNKLIHGENFSNEPGKLAVLVYPVHFNTPGRYYVWVRAYSTGAEDNGLHVGLDGTWPESGQRLQWCEGKNSWQWESKQRTNEQHCGEPYKIFLDIEDHGLHTVEFSMREDGFEFDKWLMTKDRDFTRPEGPGPLENRLK
ncbi:MAG: DUF5060 domain-containing protein [Planctomycetes bacterium]|nr:DUF5060 domain-containing protein [Planctomycetota bacterium]MBL7145850.1 DUF5060 domain-containing protein [Phycisphaerae bacterium]